MMRARPVLFPICLLACSRSGPSTTTATDAPGPAGDDAGQTQVSGESVAIVAVPQRVPSTRTWEWLFDPSGRFIAEEFDDDQRGVTACGIWDLESGTFLREHVYSDDEPESLSPCENWESHLGETASQISADGKLRASLAGGLQIEHAGGGVLRTVSGCASCGGGIAWAPSGHQIATCNGQLLEIWDADTGQRLRAEKLGLAGPDMVLLGWTEDGLGAIVRHTVQAPCSELEPEGNYCDWDGVEYDEDGEPLLDEPIEGAAVSSYWWPADGGPPIVKLQDYKAWSIDDIQADAGARWFAVSKEVSWDRDGSSTEVRVFGVGPRTSALGYTESHNEEVWIEPWNGYWRVDVATQWLEGITAATGNLNYDYAHMRVGWNAVTTEPQPAVWQGWVTEIEGVMPSGDIEVFAAFDGAAVTRWEACVDEAEEPCKSGGPPVGDCELLDVSPRLASVIVDCDGNLRLIETASGRTIAGLPQDPTTWRWGRSDYLALLESNYNLSVIDVATGKTRYTRPDVLEFIDVPLAAEQDRLALLYVDRVEIIAGANGKPVIELSGGWQSIALSPDGQQVAAIDGQQVQIIEIASDEVIVSAPVDGAWGVAWRQDGAAVFYGYDSPTHAIDPKTGQLLYELDDPVLDVFAPDEIDPSWRWIHRPDNSVIRTLDFERIELGPDWARVDSGVFEGSLASLPDNLRYRIGDDPNAPAIYTAADLERWLHTPGLVQAFFAGKPLPSPRVPAEQLAKLKKRGREG